MSREDPMTAKEFYLLMENADCDSWLKGKEIIDKVLNDSIGLPEGFKYQIRRNIKKVSNLLMLIYIFSINAQCFCLEAKEAFQALKKEENYLSIQKCMQGQNENNRQATLQLIIENYPAFLNKASFAIYPKEILFLIKVYKIFKVKSERSMGIVLKFIQNLQQVTVNIPKQYSKEALIIRIICNVLAEDAPHEQCNIPILFDEYLLGPYHSSSIELYFSFHDDEICNKTANQLLRIVEGLCSVSLNAHITRFIFRLSTALASQEEFYKLKVLYQQFTLPHLIRKGKICNRAYVQESVLELAEYYVHGFNAYIELDKSGIRCLLENIEKLSQKLQNRWISLAYFAAERPNLPTQVDRILAVKSIPAVRMKQSSIKNDSPPWKTWNITVRNIKERKIYKFKKSDLKGVKNRSSQCYIISTVQALFRTEVLGRLLDNVSKRNKYPAIRQLSKLFTLLKAQIPSASDEIRVDGLQQQGPREFAESMRQEDVHQYILALMDQLETEFKEESKQLLQTFKQSFQVQYQIKIKCLKCSNEIVRSEHTYIHTIPNTEKFKLETRELCQDYSCEKCSKKNINKTTKIIFNKCQIFIVHINRFSANEGVFKKELPGERIPRSISEYDLTGIIFHIGKNMEYGHYVYYWRKGGRTWVGFNDTHVYQFDLQHENEEFQREFKDEKTPYILFYKRRK